MDLSVETILIYTILAGILSVIYGYFTGKHILNSSPGNSKMQEIASAIQLTSELLNRKDFENYSIIDLRINGKVITE